jgi:hypothetical protein
MEQMDQMKATFSKEDIVKYKFGVQEVSAKVSQVNVF